VNVFDLDRALVSDSGLFEVNLRDERWLPFEGQGAVSAWSLTLDPRDNNFDLSSVTDVVLHIRYRRGVAPRRAVLPRQPAVGCHGIIERCRVVTIF